MIPQKENRGFTLLEVMVAVALLAIALTTLLGSQSQSVSFANSAKFETMAALLAQSKMSEITLQEGISLANDSGDFGDDYPGYVWEVEVSDIAVTGFDTISDYLKQVDLTVAWGVFSYNLRLYHYIGASSGAESGAESDDNSFSVRRRVGIGEISRVYQNGMTVPQI